MFTSNNLDKYFGELSNQMWTLLPIDPAFAAQLLISAKSRAPGSKAAGITAAATLRPDLRSDSIFWLEAGSPDQNEQRVWAELQSLKSGLQEYFRLHLSEFECHFSYYRKGQFYSRHLDTLAQNNRRMFSFVIYLNEAWQAEDGGQLRGFRDETLLFEIAPQLGSMILFRSDLEHEVLPTHTDRYALTGWFRT